MASTFTTYAAVLKERYEDSSIVDKLMYSDNVLLSMLEKRGDTGMSGDSLKVPLFYNNAQGVGGTFSIAQTNVSNTKSVAWDMACGEYYGVVHIGDKVMVASRNNAGAYLENKTVEIDSLWETAGESLSLYTWGNGGQAIGQIASIQNTNDVYLVNESDIQNFEIDMYVTASTADGSDAAHTQIDSNDQTIVTAVNANGGYFTITVADLSGLAAGNYLFREGDFFGDQGVIVVKGIQSFITANDSPPALWGVSANTRATNPQRLAGCRVPTTQLQGKSYEERIKILLARMAGRYKSKMPTAGFMHPENFQVLETLMSARGIRPLEDENTQFGFTKIDIATGSGRIPIYCDRHCPRDQFFALKVDDFWVSSMEELVHPQRGDGLEILRRATATDYEYRLISYPILGNRACKNSGRVPLAA